MLFRGAMPSASKDSLLFALQKLPTSGHSAERQVEKSRKCAAKSKQPAPTVWFSTGRRPEAVCVNLVLFAFDSSELPPSRICCSNIINP